MHFATAGRGAGEAQSLGAEDGDTALVEAAWVLLGGDLKVHREDEVCTGEVQVDGQGHLRGKAGGHWWVREEREPGQETAEGAAVTQGFTPEGRGGVLPEGADS